MLLKGLIAVLAILSAVHCRTTISPIMAGPAQNDADLSDFMVQSMFSGLRQGIAQMFDTISTLASQRQTGGGLGSNMFSSRLNNVRRDITQLFDTIAPISLADDFIVPPSADEAQTPSPNANTRPGSRGSITDAPATSVDVSATQAAATTSSPQTTASVETSPSVQTSTSTAAPIVTTSSSGTQSTSSSSATMTQSTVTSSESAVTTDSTQVVTTASSDNPSENSTCPEGVYDQQREIVTFALDNVPCDITIYLSKPPKFMRDRSKGRKGNSRRMADRYIDISPRTGSEQGACTQLRKQMYGRNTFVVKSTECVLIVSRSRGKSQPPSIISRGVN